MISKSLLRKRLSLAIGKQLRPAEFSWFFARFCEAKDRDKRLRCAKALTHDEVTEFSQYCGYDLHFPIPLPLLVQI